MNLIQNLVNGLNPGVLVVHNSVIVMVRAVLKRTVVGDPMLQQPQQK